MYEKILMRSKKTEVHTIQKKNIKASTSFKCILLKKILHNIHYACKVTH